MSLALGPFDLESLAGRGGMGEVWRARHRRSGLAAAVKRITADHAREPAFREAFRREARAVARLDHPGVVRVYDSGVDEGGAPWLAMEWGSGGTLQDAAPPTRWADELALLVALLDALAHVHARGLLHRDLKPANVLRVIDGPEQHGWRLADFGIARHAGGDAGRADSAGTPRYMAPEQARGDGRAQGPGTDLYALACLAWERLTGRPPFEGTAEELLRAHVTAAPPVFRPRITTPAGLEGWLRTLLQKDPADRFELAADARAALCSLGPPVQAAPMPAPVPAPRPSSASTQAWTWTESALDEPSDLGLPQTQTSQAQTSQTQPRASAPPPAPWNPRRPPDPPQALRPLGTGLALLGLRPVPLVGRDALRDQLWTALGRVGPGAAAALVLEGPPGTGKTRLASWLAEAAHEAGAALALRLTQNPVPGQGDSDLAQLRHALQLDGLGELDMHRRLRARLPDEAERQQLARALVVPPESPADRVAALVLGVRALSQRRPLVLHIDDAPWGLDALALVRALLDRALPVLAVLTVRADQVGPDARKSLDALVQRDDVACMPVEALPQSAGLALARGILGLSPTLAGQVAERAAGNPLMAVQLVEGWAAADALQAGPSGWELVGEARIPADLLSAWQARLDPLAAHHHALELAAVLGLQVDLAEWRAAADAAGLPQVQAAAEALEDAGLGKLADGRLVFAHGMLREALLRAAEAGDRLARWHAACAQAVPGDPPERVARHLLGAGRAADAIAPLFEACSVRRVKSEYGVALELLELHRAAMDAAGVPEGDDRRGEAMAVEVGVRWFLGRVDESEALARRTLALARRHDWVMPRLRLLINQGESLINAGELFAADPVSAEVLAVSEQHEVEPRWRVIPLISRASVVSRLGRCDEALTLLDRALAIPEGMDPRLELVVAHTRGFALAAAGRLAEARAVLEAAIQGSDPERFPWMAALLREIYATVLVLQGQLDLAEQWADQTAAAYQRVGMAMGVSSTLIHARIALARGDAEAAHGLLLRASADPYLDQALTLRADCDLSLAQALLGLGRIDQARQALGRAAPVLLRQGQVVSWQLASARALAEHPDLAADAAPLVAELARRLRI